MSAVRFRLTHRPTPFELFHNHVQSCYRASYQSLRRSNTKPLQSIHKMPKGKATATLSGRTIAETDEYEVVEGNVYVWYLSSSSMLRLTDGFHSSRRRMSWSAIPRSLLTSNRSSVNTSYLTKTDHSTHCPWKGDASYYTINLDSESQLTSGEV